MEETCTEDGCSRTPYALDLCSRHYQHRRYHGTLPSPAERERHCEGCNHPFTGRKWNARFCSRQCMEAAQYQQRRQVVEAAPCAAGCGTMLPAGRNPRQKFCSAKCNTDAHNAEMAAERLASKAGRVCRGCGGPMPQTRAGNASYCTDTCRARSRRQERYGLTRNELAVLLAQHDRCAICGTGEWGVKGPQVDHDHATGAVRGVLCGNCNQGLGRFGDDPARLRVAAEYLERVRA